MPSYIIRMQRGDDVRYLEWSSIVDAPVTYGMTLDEFREHYRERYGTDGLRLLPDRLARVEAKGTSSHVHDSLADHLIVNRAGPGETELTEAEIWDAYCAEDE